MHCSLRNIVYHRVFLHRGIAKKLKEYEYKIQRHSKTKEDYLRYIQYLMDLLKLIKQRRDVCYNIHCNKSISNDSQPHNYDHCNFFQKFGITQKKSNIDHIITNKINHLYKDAIFKFQDDIRFWIAYIKFCKHVVSIRISPTISLYSFIC